MRLPTWLWWRQLCCKCCGNDLETGSATTSEASNTGYYCFPDSLLQLPAAMPQLQSQFLRIKEHSPCAQIEGEKEQTAGSNAPSELTETCDIEAVTSLSCCLLLQRCPADSYSPGGTQVECLPCPVNTVAPPGSNTSSACVPKPGFGLVNGAVLPVSTANSSAPGTLSP
jgi:hypothetical protein